jgi:hypothetical protein
VRKATNYHFTFSATGGAAEEGTLIGFEMLIILFRQSIFGGPIKVYCNVK